MRKHVQQLLIFREYQAQLKPVPLIQALLMSLNSKSSDVRDKIYGLMGLTYDGAVIFPSPSYSSPPDALSRDATLQIISQTHSLDYIIFRNSPPKSWVIDWFGPNTWSDLRINLYLRGDSKVQTLIRRFGYRFGEPTDDLTKWTAAGASVPSIQLHNNILSVQGIMIDVIWACTNTFDETFTTCHQKDPGPDSNKSHRRVKVPSQNETASVLEYPSSYEQSALYHCLCEMTVLEEGDSRVRGIRHFYKQLYTIMRTGYLEGKRDPAEDALKTWVQSEIRQVLVDDDTTEQLFGLPVTAWLPLQEIWYWVGRLKHAPSTSLITTATAALQMGMRLCRTYGGRIGWVNKYAAPGDEVAILLGCSAPAILREMRNGTYKVVGDSIIHGLMQGQGMEYGKPELSEWPWISLC